MKTRNLLSAALMLAASSLQAQVVLDVDVAQPGIHVSPTLYGIFFEDINHAADGGLYAELIRNRSFDENGTQSWAVIGNASMQVITKDLLNEKQKNALRLTLPQSAELGKTGVTNTGFWGINAQTGQQYKLSLWARADKGYRGTLRAQLRSKEGACLGYVDLQVKLGKQWQQLTANIVATGNDAGAEFVLTGSAAGTIDLDVVSLFPPTFKNRPNGCRPDLAQMLADMHPAFMRFPGGCYVEGQDSPENAFRWERTVGPIERRPGHYDANWRYWTTDGMGFHEFLQLSEDIGAKPLYVVNVGIWHGGFTPVEELDGWIQECMDALEYANGDVTTKFGKMRADNGHPAPFNIEYLEIGNENANFHFDSNLDQSERYFERYRKFYDAVKAKYPNIKCIGNVQSWGTDSPSWRSKEPVDMLDEHYYRNPNWFANNYNKYDSYDRNGAKIYVGEYAVTSQFGKVGNLNAALGEAVYMLGMENNSDVVAMNSYAPIFINENAKNWPTDMIHYNSGKSFGTPSYWVQQLFPTHVGNRVLKSTLQWNLPEPTVAANDEPVQVGVGSWNTQVTYKDPQLIVDGKTVELAAFADWKAANERRGRGGWTVNGQEVQQNGRGEGTMFMCPTEVTAKKYTYKVKACKSGGAEGFLVVVNFTSAKDFDWCNIGGWGNTRNNIEQGNDGGKIAIADKESPFTVENGRWYDIQVDVDGDVVKCYIDGKLQMEGKHQSPDMRGVYANATLDEQNGVAYIKVINVGEGGTKGTINLQNGTAVSAEMVRLNSESGNDENTMQYPLNIVPRSANVAVAAGGKRLVFDVAPYSVNIITAKLK